MKALLKQGLLVLIPQSDEEASALASWKLAHEDHVLNVRADPPRVSSLELHDMGHRLEACREPLNVVSSSSDPRAKAISNLATSPFELDGRIYRSVESFWQGLKFEDEADRERLAALDGPHARQLGRSLGYGATVGYRGREIPVGAWEHWLLMEQACRAKFHQNEKARAALLATGERPLIHAVRRDSQTIPGVIMAQIWMRLRKEMRKPAAR
ncbi:MAG: NADAR family protein [Methylocystis sp.]|nr:NADAR family protein [Methylocystis sp.]